MTRAHPPGNFVRLSRPSRLPAVGLPLAVAVILTGCQQNGTTPVATSQARAAAAEMPGAPPKVKIVELRLESWPRVVRVQGSFLADEISIVGTKVAGRVKQVHVDLGSVVRCDDELATLESEELDLRVQQAEAQLAQARSQLGMSPGEQEDTLDRRSLPAVAEAQALWTQAKAECARAQTLLVAKVVTTEDAQQREAALAVAEAKYRAALNDVEQQVATVAVKRAELGLAQQFRIDAVIRAPFDGVIQQRHVAAGTYLAVGEPVVTLVCTDPLRFHGGIREREAAFVQLGQPAQIIVEGPSQTWAGQVSRINPALDMSSRALQVEVDLPNPEFRLRVGLFAEALITVDSAAQTLAVPATAVHEFAGVEKVWVVRDGQAVQQVVQTGQRTTDRVEIFAGLEVGQQVIGDARQGRAGPVVAE